MLTNRLSIDLIIITAIVCLVWWLQSATNDIRWSIHREIITPLYCIALGIADQIAHSAAIWHIVALELYCTTVLYLSPQNGLKMAY